MTDENTVTLSESEKAFFDSGGETAIVEAPITPEPEKIEQPAQQPEDTQLRDEKGKFVPHQALHAEREEHKKTRSELQEIRQKQAVLEDRWNTLLSATKGQDKPDDTPPDPNDDIFAFSKWQADQLKRLEGKISEREQQETQTKQHQERENAVWGYWDESVRSIKSEKTDFGDAAQFLSELRTKQLSALAPLHPQFADPKGVNEQINNELRDIIVAAAKNNINPAQAVYNLATQYGYTAKGAQKDEALTLPDKLKGIAAAQEASRTVANAPGRAGGDEMTVEALLAMPDKEFDTWTKANAAAAKRLMGG